MWRVIKFRFNLVFLVHPDRHVCFCYTIRAPPPSSNFPPRARVRGDRVHLLIISLLLSTFQFFACLGESRQKAFLFPSPLCWFFLPPEILISRRRLTNYDTSPSPISEHEKGGERADVDSRKLSPFFCPVDPSNLRLSGRCEHLSNEIVRETRKT